MRIDFYTHVHKKQRNMLFAFSKKVSEMSFLDSAIVDDIYNDLMFITNDLRHHAFSEETFVHPLLIKKMPQIERSLYQEHKELKKYLQDLENNYMYLKELVPHYKKCEAHGLEFYRMFNRFISTYFMHINEEEYVMQNLWEVAMESELIGMMIAFQTYSGIENGEKWLSDHLPSMTVDEQQLLFKTTELLAPENVFMTMCQLGEKVLGAEKWGNFLKAQCKQAL